MQQEQAKTCYVALGSNLGNSICYLHSATKTLRNHPSITKLDASNIYQSKPHGPQDQPDYFNAAIKFETKLTAEALLDLLQQIENNNKRKREGVVRWGARTLDLDLLFYADALIVTKRLSVPHPRICERAFVLLPLKDLGASNLKLNTIDTIEDCIAKLPTSEMKNCVLVNERSLDG